MSEQAQGQSGPAAPAPPESGARRRAPPGAAFLFALAPRRRLLLGAAALALFSVAEYAYTLRNPLMWDSSVLVQDDPLIRSPGNLGRIFRETSSFQVESGVLLPYYRPVTRSLFMLEHLVFGTAPAGHHLCNVALNAFAVALFFLLVHALSGDARLAFAAGLLYAANPVRGEAVYWVACQSTLLMTIFTCAALLAYHRGRRWLALFAMAAALLSRETAVLLPVALLGYEALVPAGGSRRFGRTLPFFLAVAAFLAVRTAIAGPPPLPEIAPVALLNAAAVITKRLLKSMVLPDAVVTVYPKETFASLSSEVAVAWIVIAASAAALWVLGRRHKPLAFWLGWGFLWIAVHAYVGQLSPYLMSENWAYLGSTGFCVALAALFLRLRWAWPVVTAIAVLWGGIVFYRSTFWRDPAIFMERAVAFAPNSPGPRYELALVYLRRGDRARAAAEFERVLALDPLHAPALNNLGFLLAESGHPEEAAALFRRSLRSEPGYARASYNLGVVLRQVGNTAEAMSQFEATLRLEPGYPDAARALDGMRRKHLGAIEHFAAALRARPDDASLHNEMGIALAEMGRLDEALGHFSEALRLDPGMSEARKNREMAIRLSR